MDLQFLRPGLALGAVGIAIGLGALIGLALGAAANLLWPAVGITTIQAATTVLSFNLAWWWYGTDGQRWTNRNGSAAS